MPRSEERRLKLHPGWGTASAVALAQLLVAHVMAYQALLGEAPSWQGPLLYALLGAWLVVFLWNRYRLPPGTLAALLVAVLVSAGTAAFLYRARRAGAGVGGVLLALFLTMATAGFGFLVVSVWASSLERRLLLEEVFTP